MGKIKVGIYVFTNQIKERKITDKDKYFDGKAYHGFNYIISEIDNEKYEKVYVSSANFNSVSFVLISITSFYDIYNIRKELYRKKISTKIIFGGAGISNTTVLSDIAYAICIGRGEGLINGIFDGEKYKNVWYSESDILEIGQASKLIKYDNFEEKTVGCNNKCKFCQHGWKYKLFNTSKKYNTGYINKEDIFNFLDFGANQKNYLSAIDGLTENTRAKVNKHLSDNEISDKFSTIYKSQKNYFPVQLYSIIGFPWENRVEINDFFEAIKKIDKPSNKKVNILLVATHFVPMPFTPFELYPVNLYNFRNDVAANRYKYSGKSFNVFISYKRITTPVTAIEQTIVNRIKSEQLSNFDKVLITSKYQSLDGRIKLKVIDKYFPGIYHRVDSVCENIIRPFKYKTE